MLKHLFKRPTLGLISWLLLISFYLATFLNIAFYKQVLQELPLDSVRNLLVFLSMPVVAFSVMNIVLTLASFLWLNHPGGLRFHSGWRIGPIFHHDLRHHH